MSGTVVFLGAGSSVPWGLPVTAQIFPLMLRRLLAKSPEIEPLFGNDAAARQELQDCLFALLPGLQEYVDSPQPDSQWEGRLLPITDVLSTMDSLLLTSSSPTPMLTVTALARARALLERAIFEMLVRIETSDSPPLADTPDSVRKEWSHTSSLKLLSARPQTYEAELGKVVDWLFDLKSRTDQVTLISTNYDIEIEQALFNRLAYPDVFRTIDFGTRVREPDRGTVYARPKDPLFGVYKLHGALNWLRCSVCENLYLNPVGAIAYLSFLLGREDGPPPEDPWALQLWQDGANQCQCGSRPLKHVMVAPSFVRDLRDPALNEIWRSAFEAMRQADEWIVVGYSLPPEDVALRSMFLRAFHGRDAARPRIVVVQAEEREPELTRFQLLFGGYTYVEGGLSGYLGKGNRFEVPKGIRVHPR